jgi:hypothetical protein
MRPQQCLKPPVCQPHRGWRGYSFDLPPSSFLQQIHLASIAAVPAFRHMTPAELIGKGKAGHEIAPSEELAQFTELYSAEANL